MQISSAYVHFEDEGGMEQEDYGLSVRQYLSTVNTKHHPLAEAAFLERIGSFGVVVTSSDLNQDVAQVVVKSDQLSYGAFANLMEPDQAVFLNLFFSKTDRQRVNFGIGDTQSKGYLLEIGRYLDAGHVVSFEYAHSETESAFVSFPVSRAERSSYALKSKVVKMLGAGRAVNLEGEARIAKFQTQNADHKNTVFEIKSDYYFNRSVSLGGAVSTNSGDDKFSEGESYAADFSIYWTPSFSLGLIYETFVADNASGFDYDLYLVSMALRF